ncbi:putative pentatricopeptide repeat-containing protein At1g12700, mitochondrial [Eucalyptus grandis]|uniref:putative pentatricopeptide repeat-containing protein At1g12700, mitochondrial n=1 Tax=Eucalyptus grandis TaxID=71139 RepID=UPI00192F01AC|nr:putative pentatricopeptide repeat-containing protein At1g12700, mitochondrial [Eucalyptus grandis]
MCRNGGVFSSVGDAQRCFGVMMKTDPLPSPRDFSLLLGTVVRMKHYSTAIRLIEQLHSLGVEDNHYWLTISLNCFCRLERVDLGLSILGRILKLGFPITVVATSTLIDGLFIQGKTDQALRFLDDMGRNGPEPDETTYAIIAKGLCRAGNTRLAIELLRDWEERGCRFDSFAYGIIIDSLCKKRFITEAVRLHESFSRKGVEPNVVTYNSLIHSMCDGGQMEDALVLLKEMMSGGIQPNIFTYSSLVHCLCN